MKTILYLAIATAFLCIALRCGINSTDQLAGSGSQTTNSNCVGMIFNADGSAAGRTVVRLIPEGYDPTASSAPPVDSTFTDANGKFGFMVTEANYYTITAEKGKESCMQDSVPLTVGTQTIVDNDTLKASGMLAGRVLLKPGVDPRSSIILARGTNIYATPRDSTGNFTTPLLPAGTLSLRIFTNKPGYGIVDTAVTIKNGATTELIVTIPSIDAPAVDNFTAMFDSALMVSNLCWAAGDTSKITAYALYRSSVKGNDTTFLLDKSSTTFIDDVILFEGDTLRYRIAAVGMEYREGYPTVAPAIRPVSRIQSLGSIDLQNDFSEFGGDLLLMGGRDDNCYLVNNTFIIRIAPAGATIARYDFPSGYCSLRNLQSDDAGNLYLLMQDIDTLLHSDAIKIIKFSADLTIISEFNLADSTASIFDYRLAICGNGGIFILFCPSMPLGEKPVTMLTEYDSLFNPKRTFPIASGSRIVKVQRFGNRFVTRETDYRIGYYDETFSPLSSFNPKDTSENSLPDIPSSIVDAGPCGLIFATYPLPCSNGSCPRYAIQYIDTACTFSGKKLLGQMDLFGDPDISFDSAGNLYLLDVLSPKSIRIHKYSIETPIVCGNKPE